MLSTVHISVRSLVEFILRHGDIDNRRKASSGPEVMLEGANIHRMIQRKQGKDYHAEVYLRCVILRADSEITVDGRADGLIIPEGCMFRLEDVRDGTAQLSIEEKSITKKELSAPVSVTDDQNIHVADLSGHIIIDEIKTTYRDIDRISFAEPEHLAQAMCYAYFVSSLCEAEDIGVRITYCNTMTKEIRTFDFLYTGRELADRFQTLMKSYIRFADQETGWKKIRNMSIDSMEFPYVYRTGQRELMGQVYRSIDASQRLFVMAPTGVGKTLANVYPSLKSLSIGKAEKIFYLTAKTITRTVASDCLNLLRKENGNGLRLKSVVITAKEKICPMEKCECNPEACPYAKGHFDRINDAMYDLLINEDELSRDVLLKYSEKHMVCPFEYSLDMSLFSDMIICDYNYVFDPNVYLRRYFSEGGSGSFIFLIDEAHNLVERAMKMYSASIVKEDILDVKKLVKPADPKLASALESCNRFMLTLKRECEKVLVVDDFEAFVGLLLRLSARIEQFLDETEHFEHTDEVLDFYFSLRHFLNIYENMNPSDYVQYVRLREDGGFEADLLCANPAGPVRKCTDRARASVFFSATLIPIEYYKKMLGADDSDPAVYARSVFDPKMRALLVARDVTSKYSRRSDSEYDRMAQYISEVASAKTGNYIVFFPSFAMLDIVYDVFMCRYHDPEKQDIAIQTSSMRERERESFLEKFSRTEEDEKTLIGFCVLGGIFSEGIDLKNDALIGAVIVGCGLPMVCDERELLRHCYEEMGLDGFAYAYRYPGMNKVLQAAGRVIRTEEDRGVVALLDERFLGRDYKKLFPREWEEHIICRVDDIHESLEQFWNGV